MPSDLTTSRALKLWHGAVCESVRRDGPDLSARQMAVLMTVYLADPPHTVRGLAERLGVAKPAVTRALDRLSALGYVRRKADDSDRRSILVQRTVKGSVFLSEFAEIIVQSAEESAEENIAAPD